MLNKTLFNKYNFFVFLIWPLVALLIAFKKKEHNFIKVFLPLFTGILGYTYVPKPGSDVNRTIEKFNYLNSLRFSEKVEYLVTTKILNILDQGLELYLDLLSFLTSLLTDNYRLMLFVMGYIYGVILYNLYIQLKASQLPNNTKFASIILFFCIALIQPSMALNGRFWLATLLLLNFVIHYYNDPKIKYLLYSILCVFIHKGFLLAIVLFFLWHFTKTIKFKKYIYIGLLLSSIITPGSLMLNYVREGDELLGDSYNNQIEGYTREEYIENQGNVSSQRSALFNFYSLRNNVVFYAASFFLFFLFKQKKYRLNSIQEHFFYLVILFISFSNFFIEVPSLGSRYRFIAICLMILYFYKTLTLTKVEIFKSQSIILLAALFFNFIISLRMDLEQLYAFSYLLNPLFAFLYLENITIL